MYATIRKTEVKLSGMLAAAVSKITTIDNGVAVLSRDQVMQAAVELAGMISDRRVLASEPYSIIEISIACDKLLTILDWLELNEQELVFA